MSLISVLRTGVSGMNAQSSRISTVAENIQNAGTTGYKRTGTEFSSLILDSSSTGDYNSGAVETVIRRSVSAQGPVSFTTSKTDLAIQGNGFFVVRDSNNATSLTRSGNFVEDGPTGNLVNSGGFTLMGYAVGENGEATPALNSTAGMVPVNVSTLGMKATASKTASIGGNLPAGTDALTGTLSSTVYTKKTSMVTYDQLGNKVTVDIALGKTATANEWKAEIYAPGSTTAIGTTTLTFDPDTGKIATASAAAAKTDLTFADGRKIALDMSSITQLAGSYDLKGTADGKAPSAVTGSDLASDGSVYALYEDGSRMLAFKVPLANVASPDNLEPRAGNIYLPTSTSGDLQIGFAGLSGLGSIKSSALEQSNVDVSSELTAMIESQSVYTANSKVFMTGNELLETLMNLKR
ncbi:flagellar biosynthesis protein FlgE [Methylobacterium sp. Leaf102]|uniref:flagellar hook protein FlgE n=1 Tax=Methylobacterium sp. Leaf102 TaxID=1736253 RepID=UPI0006F34D0C|nr:flagellar hook protein FlgE [Methylobacterium sp. Leaf102]KQP34430.1 flagellar biosynthesis protein FlgE [Methylobacterium sp. Leaf102]